MAILFNPSVYLYHHQLGGVPFLNLTGSVEYEGEWFVHNAPEMLFTLNGQNVPEISGTGNQNLVIKMTNAINQYDEGLYEFHLRAFNAAGDKEAVMTIFVIVAADDNDVVLPNRMNFEAVRNVEFAPAQRFFVATGQAGITTNLPSWLEISEYELIGGGHIVGVRPVSHAETPLKNYIGQIELLIPGEAPQNINVKYNIHAGYDEEYTKAVHFTRDNDELVFYKTTPDKSFLRLATNIRSFTSSGSIHSDTQLSLDIPFVNNRAKINIGRELEDYLSTDTTFNKSGRSRGVYPPLELRATAIEIKQDDFSILNQDALPLQYYLSGRNPLSLKAVNHPFWCVSRPSVTRLISTTGIISLSVFKPAKDAIKNFILRKNGVFVKNITPQNQTFGQMRPYFVTANVGLTGMQLAVGDVLSFEYEGISQQREFIIRPPSKESIPVAFLTIFNTYELFEFTGGYSDSIDYEHSIVDTRESYLEITKKLFSKNPQKITLNTGWILKDEVFIIDELIRSKQAMIPTPTMWTKSTVYAQETILDINLIPVSSKIVSMDSENNRRQYDVEFLVNQNYENEILTR